MGLLILLLLDSWPVSQGRVLLEELHSYDLLACEVRATPVSGGLDVDCRLRLRVLRPGPLRFFLSREVGGLSVRCAGEEVPAGLDDSGFARLVRVLSEGVAGVPALLTLRPPAAPAPGEEAEFHLRYRWTPSGTGPAYAGERGVQTHLSSFWLPTMADELFDVSLKVRTELPTVGSGRRGEDEAGWRSFRSVKPLQVACLVSGDFRVRRREFAGRELGLYLPPGLPGDPEALLDDLAAVLVRLEELFGPALGSSFDLVVEPRLRPLPSYCAGSFAVVHRSFLPDARGREAWLAHLAHECAHVWFGHKLVTPVVGGGGTWLREGLAEWGGITVAGLVAGEGVARRLYRSRLRGYFRSADLRRAEGANGILFANEPTLIDATYLDRPGVAYLRGALVHRHLEARMGRERFVSRLRAFVEGHAYRFVTAREFARAMGEERAVAYYAGTTGLPDLVLGKVSVTPDSARAEVTCLDPGWPGGGVPCRIWTRDGASDVAVQMRDGRGRLEWRGAGLPERIELDPERLTLDPVRSNNLWPRER
jgi:hypothetical protein